MKESSSRHLRQLIAQHAARILAEEGFTDYARAKRKAARQLGATDDHSLPSNAEVAQELRLHHEIFRGDVQPQLLHQLRVEALAVMKLLERFNPHLAGGVLDGTAGRYADTEIHLFVDSVKDVELFLLNNNIPYRMDEKAYRFGNEKQRMPAFLLEGEFGTVRLVVFATDDLRATLKNSQHGNTPTRATAASVAALLQQQGGG
jgi:hypothetical protein